MTSQSPLPDRRSGVDAPSSDEGAEGDHGERLIRRRDVAVGVILVGVVWSWVSFYLTAAEFLLGDAVDPGAPEWAVDVMIVGAPITTVVALIGVVFRRRWVRWPAAVLTVALIGLWIVARIELAPSWSDPLFGLLSFPGVAARGG